MGIVSCMQGRKLLMNSPRVYEKTLHFARADRAVRPYNVFRKIFCKNGDFARRCTNILRKRMRGVKRIDSDRICSAVSIG